jgi:hypothetical protein
MSHMTVFSQICRCPSCELKPASASNAFFEPSLSLARQTREPRDELIDRSVEVFMHRIAMDVTSRQSQARPDGKQPVCAGFFAQHNLRAQNVAGNPRQAGDFLLDELS